MLALIPVAVAFAALSGDTWRRRAAAAGLVAAAALACIAPVTAHNAGAGAGFTPISTDGGIRLYTGTSPTYRGIIGPLAGRDTEELVRAPAKLGVDTEAGRSRYYTRRAFELMSSRPSRYAGLVASKLYMFWHGHELAGDYDLYAARRDSPVLATVLYHSVVLYFPFGLLAPLGLLGIAIAWRRSGARLLAAFVAVQLTGAVLFVVTAGLRLPAVAVLGIFAAAGAVWLYDRAHEPARRRQLVIAACAVAALYGAINVPYPFAGRRTEYAIRMAADRLHTRGVALYQRGESLEAAKTLHRSVALHPTALSLRDYAKSLIVIGRNAEGIEALVQSIELATGDIGAEHWIPANGELIARLRDVVPRPADLADWEVFFQGHACYRRHKWDCAIPAFEQVISESSEETGLHTSAEFLYARSIAGEGMDMAAQHRYKSAIRKLHRAQALGAGNIETRLLLALSYLRRKNTLIARHEFLTCRFTEIPAGAFFHLLARPDNDIEGALGFTVVTGYLSLIPDDPLAIAAQDIIQAHWRTKEGLQPK
jgi:tetratricopeptide (TPR) repeat protein